MVDTITYQQRQLTAPVFNVYLLNRWSISPQDQQDVQECPIFSSTFFFSFSVFVMFELEIMDHRVFLYGVFLLEML